MSKIHLIGIIGQKTSGKTTTAEILADYFGYKSVTHLKAFATPLKNAAYGLFSQCLEPEKSAREAITGLTWREIYQRMGDSIKQAFGEDIFIQLMHTNFSNLKMLDSVKDKYLIIDDMRFENEVNWLLRQGGVILHVNRTDVNIPFDPHVSETLARNFRSSIYMSQIGFGKIAFVDNPGTDVELSNLLEEKIIPWLEVRDTTWQIGKTKAPDGTIEYCTADLEEHQIMTKKLVVKELPPKLDSGDHEYPLEDNSWVRDVK